VSYPPPGSDPDRPQDATQPLPAQDATRPLPVQDSTRPLPTYGRPPETTPANPYQQTDPYRQQSSQQQSPQQSPYGQPPQAGQQPPQYGQQQPQPGQPTQYGQQPQYGQQVPQYGQQVPYGQPPVYGQGVYPTQYPTPYGYGYGYAGTAEVKTNGLAIAALICGLAGFVVGISAPVAVGLGIAALVQIKRRGEQGTGLAVGGIVTGGLVTVFGGALLAILIVAGIASDGYEGDGANVLQVNALTVGECFDDGWSDDEVYREDCDVPHDAEITANYTLQASLYPGDDRVEELARDRCAAEFSKYVGNTVDKSELISKYWYPAESDWAKGDQLVICAAYGPDDDQLTETVKDSKR
jgi:uncharacterized protein DUF4190/putative regulator of septum formation